MTFSDEESGAGKQYTGQQKEFVSTLGAYYYNARFYSTTLGTFMSADTLTTDGLNRYAYVRGNPLRYNDPSGHGVTGGGGLNEGYCPATNPACFHDGGGPVGGTGKPAPVVDRCDAVCRALKALYHAGLTSPELVEQARGGAAHAPNVRASENGGSGGRGCAPLDWACRARAKFEQIGAGVRGGLQTAFEQGAAITVVTARVTIQLANPFSECHKTALGTAAIGAGTIAVSSAFVEAAVVTAEVPPVAAVVLVEGGVVFAAGAGATAGSGYSAYRICTGSPPQHD